MEQKQPGKRKGGEWYIIVGGVLGMLLVGYLLSPAVRDTPRAAATPPRGLVLPPTLTQAQRATATAHAPTPTPTLLPHLAITLYFSQVLPQQDILIDAEETMSSLLKNPRLGDSAWHDLFAAQVAKVWVADFALRKIVPPERCREAHALLLSSTGDSVLGYKYVLRGSQQLDPALLRKGGEYIKSATAKMNLFNLMLLAITP